ncbi:MAG: hypothetical protein K2X81_17670 [Candidatus Obscuribacterales bacterium]|nr:hypothetical protein [Candidatus Obscuribacterales bacterium]
MGADIIGWRKCPLQQQLGPEGFLSKIKLRAYKQLIEQQVPIADRDKVRISIVGTNRQPQELGYAGIVKGLAGFEKGIPECTSCPISGREALGCYRYISYPVDEEFEQLVFAFFTSQVEIEDSICNQIYSDIVSQFPNEGTPWHSQRGSGEQGGLAKLPQPLKYDFRHNNEQQSVDSAQLLMSLFIPLNSAPMVVGYASFWLEFLEFVAAHGSSQSRTIAEIDDLTKMLIPMVPIALKEGGFVFVDG